MKACAPGYAWFEVLSRLTDRQRRGSRPETVPNANGRGSAQQVRRGVFRTKWFALGWAGRLNQGRRGVR